MIIDEDASNTNSCISTAYGNSIGYLDDMVSNSIEVMLSYVSHLRVMSA